MLRKSTRLSNVLIPGLNAYENAYLQLAGTIIRGSLLEAPQQKLGDTMPIFQKCWRNDLFKLRSSTRFSQIPQFSRKSSVRSSIHNVRNRTSLVPRRIRRTQSVALAYRMSKWINDYLLLTYNPLVYFYESRVGVNKKCKLSKTVYRRELKKVKRALRGFTGSARTPYERGSYNFFRCYSDLLGLPQDKQQPQRRQKYLFRVLTTTTTGPTERRPKKGKQPQVFLHEAEKNMMSASMLKKVLRLRKQRPHLANIRDVSKYLTKMLDIPLIPSQVFVKFLLGYHERREMLSKFSNRLVFYNEYHPAQIEPEQLLALKNKQKDELLRYLQLEKTAGLSNNKALQQKRDLVMKL